MGESTLLIDGNVIIDDLMGPGDTPGATLSRLRVGAGSDPNTYSFYIDNFLLEAAGSPPPEKVLLYYGLGDSVASGHGLPGDPDEGDELSGCHRAPGAYPNTTLTQLKEDANIQARYKNVVGQNLACSGADSRDLKGQIDTLLEVIEGKGSDVDVLVSITIGANDFPFIPYLSFKFFNLFCSSDKQFEKKIDQVSKGIARGVQQSGIQSLLEQENVHIVFTDYHNPFNRQSRYFQELIDHEESSGPTCSVLKGLSREEGLQKMYQRTEQAVHRLNDTLLDLTNSFGPEHVRMASVHDAFHEDEDGDGGGHESPTPDCGTAPPTVETTWVQSREVLPGIFFDCLHPNLAGAGKFAEAVQVVAEDLLPLD